MGMKMFLNVSFSLGSETYKFCGFMVFFELLVSINEIGRFHGVSFLQWGCSVNPMVRKYPKI